MFTPGQAKAASRRVNWHAAESTIRATYFSVGNRPPRGLRNPAESCASPFNRCRTLISGGSSCHCPGLVSGTPGRDESVYSGDHYIVITAGIGYDRIMTAEELARAMDASDAPLTGAPTSSR